MVVVVVAVVRYMTASTSMGVKQLGKPISLDSTIPKVDLLIIGSVAVSPL